jgi:lipopolysaccharide transport system permease protein
MGYGLYVCAGLITWGLFAELLSRCPTLFIEQANLIKKINFPRITLPVIIFFSTAINFIIIFSLFIIFLIFTGRFPGWVIIGFLPLLCIQQVFVLGIGMLLGTLNVFFRDVGQLLAVILQFWFWLTPIVYPLSILPERLRRIIVLNPMTQMVDAYQKIILYAQWPNWSQFTLHFIGALLALAIGFITFQRLSAEIVDEL